MHRKVVRYIDDIERSPELFGCDGGVGNNLMGRGCNLFLTRLSITQHVHLFEVSGRPER